MKTQTLWAVMAVVGGAAATNVGLTGAAVAMPADTMPLRDPGMIEQVRIVCEPFGRCFRIDRFGRRIFVPRPGVFVGPGFAPGGVFGRPGRDDRGPGRGDRDDDGRGPGQGGMQDGGGRGQGQGGGRGQGRDQDGAQQDHGPGQGGGRGQGQGQGQGGGRGQGRDQDGAQQGGQGQGGGRGQGQGGMKQQGGQGQGGQQQRQRPRQPDQQNDNQ